jgi:hypothetical protein
MVEISFVVTNISAMTTMPEMVEVRAAGLGAFMEWMPLHEVEIPSLQPGESYGVIFWAENHCTYQGCPANELCMPECINGTGKADLKPQSAMQGGVLPPPPSGSFPCPPGGWGGNIDIFWNGAQQAILHLWSPVPASLGHPTYVHVCIGDFTNDNYTWNLLANCPGWTVSFVAEDANGQPIPGSQMLNPVGNFGCGYICAIPDPTQMNTCTVTLNVTNSAGFTSTVTMTFDSNLCAPTQIDDTSWGEVKDTYR